MDDEVDGECNIHDFPPNTRLIFQGIWNSFLVLTRLERDSLATHREIYDHQEIFYMNARKAQISEKYNAWLFVLISAFLFIVVYYSLLETKNQFYSLSISNPP